LVLEFWFAVYALFWAVRLRRQIDTVVAVIPPEVYLPVLRAVLPKRVRLVALVHDLQGVMATSTKSRTRGLVAWLLRRIEKRALAACGKVICLSESIREFVVEHYGVPRDKSLVQYPFPTLSTSDEGGRVLQECFPDGFHHVVYAGGLGEKQMPGQLVDFFAALCQRRADIMCHVFSAGLNFARVQREMKGWNVDRLHFRDLVPEEQLAELYARSTVQVVPQASGTGAGAFPSKLPNLLAAGVPVFAICDRESELATVVRESQAGTVAEGAHPGQWVEQMTEFLDRISGTPHSTLRQRSQAYLGAKFDLDRLVAAIIA
jgi:glycosyltransferase involved in cell wall biosynthesis